VRLQTEGDPNELPEDVQTALFRITQEALANAGRHAGATAVEVDVAFQDGRVDLRVRDDGEGFDPGSLSSSERGGAGLGLGGMAERARLVGGELDVRSAPGGGTTVTLRIGGDQ
jgi:signal transduction histidine kinase